MSEEDLINRITLLEGELQTARAQVTETYDLLQMMIANGLDKFLTGHGFMQYGGGVDRLDTNGIGIMPETGGGNRGVWLVQNFDSYPPNTTTGRYGAIYAPLFDANDNELLIQLQNAQNQNISVDFQLLGSGGAGTLIFENRHPTYGVGRAELITSSTETYFTLDFGTKITPLGLSTDTVDPPVFRDGYLWYRSDTDKVKARINGATENLAVESWVTSNFVGGSSWSAQKVLSAATTNGTVIKASAGTLGPIAVQNTNAAVRYLKVYDSATVTVGTTVPKLTFAIPPSATGKNLTFISDTGIPFSTGICFGLTTGAADNDTGAVAANEITGVIGYA